MFLTTFIITLYRIKLNGTEITIKVINEHKMLLLNIDPCICMLSSAIISRNVAAKYESKNSIRMITYMRMNTRHDIVKLNLFFFLCPMKYAATVIILTVIYRIRIVK